MEGVQSRGLSGEVSQGHSEAGVNWCPPGHLPMFRCQP